MNEVSTAGTSAGVLIEVPSYVWLKIVKHPYSPAQEEEVQARATGRPPRLTDGDTNGLQRGSPQLVFTKSTWETREKAKCWRKDPGNAWWFTDASSFHLVMVEAG